MTQLVITIPVGKVVMMLLTFASVGNQETDDSYQMNSRPLADLYFAFLMSCAFDLTDLFLEFLMDQHWKHVPYERVEKRKTVQVEWLQLASETSVQLAC